MAFRVGIIGCGRMADTIEDEQISRRKTHSYRGGLVLPYSHAAGYTAVKETEIVCRLRHSSRTFERIRSTLECFGLLH